MGQHLDARLDRHRRADAALTALADEELQALTAPVGAGGVVDLDGVRLFVKRLPLTDRERDPAAVGSTANLVDLPAHCHFGVGSPGFGAWRELAATRTTSSWVGSGRHEGFLLLHHWRVLPGAPPVAEEFRDVERTTAFWGGHPAVRDRLRSLATASASLVLVLEYVPQTLGAWLDRSSDRVVRTAAAGVETQLLDLAAFSAAHGLIHFDAHLDNVLTDGRRLYLADLGLATTADVALSQDEIALVEAARTHDLAYAMTRLVTWAVSRFGDPSPARDPVARHALVRAHAEGVPMAPLPEPAAGIVRRYARVAAIMNAFYAELFTIRRDAPYPAAAVEAEVARLAADGTLMLTRRSS